MRPGQPGRFLVVSVRPGATGQAVGPYFQHLFSTRVVVPTLLFLDKVLNSVVPIAESDAFHPIRYCFAEISDHGSDRNRKGLNPIFEMFEKNMQVMNG